MQIFSYTIHFSRVHQAHVASGCHVLAARMENTSIVAESSMRTTNNHVSSGSDFATIHT